MWKDMFIERLAVLHSREEVSGRLVLGMITIIVVLEMAGATSVMRVPSPLGDPKVGPN